MIHQQLTVVLGLIEREGKFLLTRRVDPKHPQWHLKWEIPGGKIEPEETPIQALLREIWEETQLSIHSQELLGVHTHHWQTSKGIQQTFMLVYHCQTKPGDVILSPEENDDFVWENMDEIVQRQDLLDGTVDIFHSLVRGLQNSG
jgi:mutator protein MutT